MNDLTKAASQLNLWQEFKIYLYRRQGKARKSHQQAVRPLKGKFKDYLTDIDKINTGDQENEQ